MFIRKNLINDLYASRRNRVLKGLILFFLGASATLLMTYADVQINTNITNAVSYIKKMVLTLDGTANTATGIILDGSLGQVQSNKYCDLSGSNCIIPGKFQYLNIGYSLTIPSGTLQCSCDATPAQDCGLSFYTTDYANYKCYDILSNGYMIYEKNGIEKDPVWALESGNYMKTNNLLTTLKSALGTCTSGQVLKATDTSFVCSD